MKFTFAITALASIFLLVYSQADEADHDTGEEAVRKVLADQAKAWNNGNIDDFMKGYVKSESLRFASGGTVTSGWKPTLDRYKSRYTDRETMGTLTFSGIHVLVLSSSYAEVFGKWKLERVNQSNPSGLFTLLMKKTPNGWRVFHDHTSSAE